MEGSLRFYGAVGVWWVVLDQKPSGAAAARIPGMEEVSVLIVLMKFGAQETGLVCFLSYISPGTFRPAEPSLECFSHAPVFIVNDIDAVCTRLLDSDEKSLSSPVRAPLPRGVTVRIVTCVTRMGYWLNLIRSPFEVPR